MRVVLCLNVGGSAFFVAVVDSGIYAESKMIILLIIYIF